MVSEPLGIAAAGSTVNPAFSIVHAPRGYKNAEKATQAGSARAEGGKGEGSTTSYRFVDLSKKTSLLWLDAEERR